VDLESGLTEPFETHHTSYASGCVFLPDGETVVSAGYDGCLLWHDIRTKRSWRRLKAHNFWSWQMALSPDGQRIASVTGQYIPGGWKYEPAGESEPSVKVFDAASGELIAAYQHTPPVLSCAFSPDGSHLAAANMMGEVRIWNLGSGTESHPVAQWTSPDFTSWGSIKTHHYCGGIYGLAFSPDSSALLCCGMGAMGDPMAGNGKMTWQRWAWQRGERIDQIKDGQHGAGLMESVHWHPDGAHFIMAGRQAGWLQARASQFWKISRQLPAYESVGRPSRPRVAIVKRFQGRLGSPCRRLKQIGTYSPTILVRCGSFLPAAAATSASRSRSTSASSHSR
jgi:WD40 repeat protein